MENGNACKNRRVREWCMAWKYKHNRQQQAAISQALERQIVPLNILS